MPDVAPATGTTRRANMPDLFSDIQRFLQQERELFGETLLIEERIQDLEKKGLLPKGK